jgi:hypothetical protein
MSKGGWGVRVGDWAADKAYRIPGGYYRAEGYIKNFNTIEEYKNVERSKVVDLAARTVSEPALICCSHLMQNTR